MAAEVLGLQEVVHHPPEVLPGRRGGHQRAAVAGKGLTAPHAEARPPALFEAVPREEPVGDLRVPQDRVPAVEDLLGRIRLNISHYIFFHNFPKLG